MTGISGKLNIALPDGHLLHHLQPFLEKTGMHFEGYAKTDLNRRPALIPSTARALELLADPGLVAAKVVRPQDMPTHVANSNFDLAVSGTDWLREHKLRFPSSPVTNVLNMGFGAVRIVAAVHQSREDSISACIRGFRRNLGKSFFRIATEYVHLANDFAQRNGLDPYRIIMTYGATESMIPEDCDLIIENTETGNTLRQNDLKIIDTIMASEACLIASEKSLGIAWKRELIEGIRTLFVEGLK